MLPPHAVGFLASRQPVFVLGSARTDRQRRLRNEVAEFNDNFACYFPLPRDDRVLQREQLPLEFQAIEGHRLSLLRSATAGSQTGSQTSDFVQILSRRLFGTAWKRANSRQLVTRPRRSIPLRLPRLAAALRRPDLGAPSGRSEPNAAPNVAERRRPSIHYARTGCFHVVS